MKFIYWTADKDSIICRSSQWRFFNLSGWKEETWKIQAWTGIEPMTSAIPVQRSNQLSYQANWACWLERCTGIAEVVGSIPVQAWIFSGLFFSTT